ncbi:MGH1-like glycoside hydrolase domain-containing protein [Candidatus Palauibacter sp.]|uniref:MGH1-like glycoside hydrolase domain-containing protein n=1 Tax=Candidatus Palauibacter sp. TaxID=3101350 RepID=UPI003B023519
MATAEGDTWPDRLAEYASEVGDGPEYRAIQQRLASGWNTWDSRDVLRFVLLPEGLTLDLSLKRHAWLEEGHLETALIGRDGVDAERVRPGPRSMNGSYMRLDMEWQGLTATVEAGHAGDDMRELVVLVTPRQTNDTAYELIVSGGLAWNAEGTVETAAGGFLARLPSGTTEVYLAGREERDPYTQTLLPHRVLRLDREAGISSGRERSLADIRAILDSRRSELAATAAEYGELADAFLAISSGIAWNTVYEPRHGRVVSTVGRLWNQEYGGVALFGWDNFFLAYLTALYDRDLALANVIEHLRGATPEGFLPNDNRGNGSKSWDRSQPPVGGLMVREVYRRFPERWFLEAAFEPLMAWNRWWPRKRLNEGLLSYGSHEAPNPFNEPDVQSVTTAGYESGMDDSPMYENVPFNPAKNTLELQDVGLTSLYIADCLALSELARVLGRHAEAQELAARARRFTAALEGLWDEERGYYLNYRTDLDRFSGRRSPTLFYPLIAGVPGPDRAERLVREHLLNPAEFWGEYVLPSTTRDDPSFPRQRYWKGAIWPPLNFLVYLGLRNADAHDVASDLAERSLRMFVREWRRKGYVSENYSSITGAGDDQRLSSDPFHSWGGLFGIMAFIESGHLLPPEAPIHREPE